MARRRASMREGPLAELFRATEAAQRQAEQQAKEEEPAPKTEDPEERTVEHVPTWEETARTGSRPLSNHASPGCITRGAPSPTVTSSPPHSRQRMPPPRWRCGGATPPGSKSTRSHRINQAGADPRSIGCSSSSRPVRS